MLSVGVDLIEVRRIEEVVARYGTRFLERVFTPGEQAYCQGRSEALAARWAAKEAVAKALGTGMGDVRWREIEIVCDGRGKPHVRLHGAAYALAERMGIQEIAVSLSHTREHAVAFVVVIGEQEGFANTLFEHREA